MSQQTSVPDITDLIQARQPTRVLILIRNTSPIIDNESVPDETIIRTSLSKLDFEPSLDQHRFVAKKMWGIVDMYVVDLYHNAYGFSTAHHPETLPVITVDHGRHIKVYMASRGRQGTVNKQVAELHNLHGWDAQLPLVSDHSHGRVPCYPKPRDTSILHQGAKVQE